MSTLEPLQSLYTKEKIREMENSHALQQMTLLGEKVMEAGHVVQHKIGDLSTAFEDDETTSAGGGEVQGEAGGNDQERQRDVATSFQRIVREETDLDLVFRSDHDDTSSKAYRRERQRDEGSNVEEGLTAEDSDSTPLRDEQDDDDDDNEAGSLDDGLSIRDIRMEEATMQEDPGEVLPTAISREERRDDESTYSGKGKEKARGGGKTSSGERRNENVAADVVQLDDDDDEEVAVPRNPIKGKEGIGRTNTTTKNVGKKRERGTERGMPTDDTAGREEEIMFPPKQDKKRRKKEAQGFADGFKKLIRIQMDQLKRLSYSFSDDVANTSSDDSDVVAGDGS